MTTLPMTTTTLHDATWCMRMKNAVKKGLKESLTVGSVWAPVAMRWFEAWKAYVDFEDDWLVEERGARPADLMQSLHPGPIDNSPLQGAVGDELRRGLTEDVDYVLLPLTIFETTLVGAFGGGPNFSRKVQIKHGSSSMTRTLFLDLYPVRHMSHVKPLASTKANLALSPTHLGAGPLRDLRVQGQSQDKGQGQGGR